MPFFWVRFLMTKREFDMTFKTADLSDENEGRVQAVLPGLLNFGGNTRFYGEMVTIRSLGDFSLVRDQFKSPGAGKVLVVDNDALMDCAMLGDLLEADFWVQKQENIEAGIYEDVFPYAQKLRFAR
jgi:regulator of RNase E activity RraA